MEGYSSGEKEVLLEFCIAIGKACKFFGIKLNEGYSRFRKPF